MSVNIPPDSDHKFSVSYENTPECSSGIAPRSWPQRYARRPYQGPTAGGLILRQLSASDFQSDDWSRNVRSLHHSATNPLANSRPGRRPILRTEGQKTRNGILEDFKRKHGFNILILSPFVAGIGITIMEANHVFHYGRWWNPAVESQATDRVYRIGQKKEAFVHIPIHRDPSKQVPVTFDERLDSLMDRKYRLAEEFLKPLQSEEEIGGQLLNDLLG